MLTYSILIQSSRILLELLVQFTLLVLISKKATIDVRILARATQSDSRIVLCYIECNENREPLLSDKSYILYQVVDYISSRANQPNIKHFNYTK